MSVMQPTSIWCHYPPFTLNSCEVLKSQSENVLRNTFRSISQNVTHLRTEIKFLFL